MHDIVATTPVPEARGRPCTVIPLLPIHVRPRTVDLLAARAALLVAIANVPVRPIGLHPAPQEFDALAITSEKMVDAFRIFFAALIGHADENDRTAIVNDADLLHYTDHHLHDVRGDLGGTLRNVADDMRDGR